MLPKLSIDEREMLAELMEHPGFPVILKELEALKAQRGLTVLEFNLEDSELLRRKCRLDGAHELLTDFKRRLETLKPKHDAKGS